MLGIGHDIRGWNVPERTDVSGQLANPATANLLLLSWAEVMGIADHPAFSAAQRDIHHGTFPGHPHSQSLYPVGGFQRMEADAALGRTPGVVVLYAKASEHLDAAVIHPHRDGHVVFPHRVAQKISDGIRHVENVRYPVELGLSHLEGVVILFRHDNASQIKISNRFQNLI
jgi:hypothetical protein